MNIDDRLLRLVEVEKRTSDAAERAEAAALKGGGGSGTSGGMEERVIRLEGDVGRMKADVAELRTDVGKIKIDLATLSERVSHLPTKGLIVGSAMTTIGAITGLLVLLQHLGILH